MIASVPIEMNRNAMFGSASHCRMLRANPSSTSTTWTPPVSSVTVSPGASPTVLASRSANNLVPIAGDQVDHVGLQGLVRRDRRSLADRVDREVHVAPALLGDRLGVGGRVVDHLLFEVLPAFA